MAADGKLTIVVASCDRYADLLPPFAALWRRFWPTCPYPVALVTEHRPDAADPAVFSEVIACGPGLTWGDRLAIALGRITTPYVMLLCDDYYLEAPVPEETVAKRLDQIERFGAVNLRLIPNPVPQLPFAPDPTLGEYRKATAYCISTLAGLWDRAFLLSLLEGCKSIWEFERYGSFKVGDESRPILATREREFPFVDAVHKGYWERFGVEVCRKNGVEIDWARRGLPPFKVRLIEGLKAAVFACVSPTLIVKIQNRFGWGKKEGDGKG